jgi:hypothetical protein
MSILPIYTFYTDHHPLHIYEFVVNAQQMYINLRSKIPSTKPIYTIFKY